MKLRIDLRILLFLILFYITKQINIYIMVLIFALIHEMGHLIAGIMLGMKPKKIEMMPTGLSISFKIKAKDYNKKILKANVLEVKKIIVALAGPLTNFIIILLVNKLNLNIYIYLIIILGRKKSIQYIYNVSFFVIILITIIAIILMILFKNIAIMVAITYMWYLFLREVKRYKIRKQVYEIIENYW